MERQYLELKLKHLISHSGIRLVTFYFKDVIGIDLHYVRLGEVGLYYDPIQFTTQQIETIFSDTLGFPCIHNAASQSIEKIKIAVIELIVYDNNKNSLIRNSNYISEKLQMPYDKLTRLFSQQTGHTLEQYILAVKIERIKTLLLQEDYTVSEISYMMGYSSVQYLSNQFKKATGQTISEYKKQPAVPPLPLEDIL